MGGINVIVAGALGKYSYFAKSNLPTSVRKMLQRSKKPGRRKLKTVRHTPRETYLRLLQ